MGVSDRKYVNVDFGAGSSRPALQNGHHYYVCIHAKAEDVTFEKWTERLPDVTGCSDGVTVDLTPPVGGVVSVDGLLRGMYQVFVFIIKHLYHIRSVLSVDDLFHEWHVPSICLNKHSYFTYAVCDVCR